MTRNDKNRPQGYWESGKRKRSKPVNLIDDKVEIMSANFEGNRSSVLSHLKLAADRVATLDQDTLKSIHIEVKITARKEPDNIINVDFGGDRESAF